METKKIPVITLAVFSIVILLSTNYERAFAVSGFQTQTAVNVTGGLTLSSCGGIAVTPVTNYIIQQCDNGGSIQTTVVSYASGTQIANATRTVGTGETSNTDCYANSNTQAVCETGRSSVGTTVLIRANVLSSTSISIDTFNLGGAGAIAGGINSIAGTAIYWGASDGSFGRFALQSFSQTGTWTGLTTGGCGTLRTALAINSNTGISICDINEIYLFSFLGSGGGITYTGSANLVGSFISGTSVKIFYSNGYLYITDRTQNRVQAIGVDITTRTFTTNGIQYPIFAGDIKGTSGYILLIDGSTDQIYLLDRTIAPPNNIVVVQSLSTVVQEDVKLTTTDSSTFYWSKGNSGGTTVTFFKGTDLRNEKDQSVVDITPVVTGGIDCSLPANVNILICRITAINQTPLAGASILTNQSATNISCQVGIIACTDGIPDNPDIKTNGIGYILLMVGLGIFVGLLWVASRGQITEIPNYVWMVGTIAVVGAITVVGWIDPTILIVSIITVIALAGIKAKNVFGGVGGLFKGEEA